MSDKRYLNDEVELWKEKRYYEKVLIDYYSTEGIDPDIIDQIVGGLIRYMSIVEQQQQKIEHLQEELVRWEAGLNQTKEMYELQRQLRQANEKINKLKKTIADKKHDLDRRGIFVVDVDDLVEALEGSE